MEKQETKKKKLVKCVFSIEMSVNGEEEWISQDRYDNMDSAEKEDIHRRMRNSAMEKVLQWGSGDIDIEIEHTGEDISYSY
ncbi:MAG: hypothetical protein CBB96_00880 [Gammaproteobacteria bacterium TMED36]|nr:MAG: hypothetical protein CBB96_00880 [Gammaproteobacteria bacterium TMED36]|tara:strand:+ start:1224 stop:1466 length:243 start_codon:yes stop_codon:yes gene_type:complete